MRVFRSSSFDSITYSILVGLFRVFVQSIRLLRRHQQYCRSGLDQNGPYAPIGRVRLTMRTSPSSLQSHQVSPRRQLRARSSICVLHE